MYLADDIFTGTSGWAVNGPGDLLHGPAHPLSGEGLQRQRLARRGAPGDRTRLLPQLDRGARRGTAGDLRGQLQKVRPPSKRRSPSTLAMWCRRCRPECDGPPVPWPIKRTRCWVDVTGSLASTRRFAMCSPSVGCELSAHLQEPGASPWPGAGVGGQPCWPAPMLLPTAQYERLYGPAVDHRFLARGDGEFGLPGSSPVSSFPLDPTKERWSMCWWKHGCSLGVTGIGTERVACSKSFSIKPLASAGALAGLAHQQP